MLAHGHGHGMVTGATRKSAHVLGLVNHVFDAGPADGAVGVSAVLHKGRIVLIADTLVHEWPDEQDLALIARRAVAVARDLGLSPRVAFLSFSTFGSPVSERATKMQMAPRVLDEEGADFEYEGEMTVDVALNPRAQEAYPFSRLTGPANVPRHARAALGLHLRQAHAGDGGRDGHRAHPRGRGPAHPDLLDGGHGVRHPQHGRHGRLPHGHRAEGPPVTVWNLGSINADHVYALPHVPRAGETLAATSLSYGLGGKGANMSVALARAGADVRHLGAVGADGAWMVERLASYGVRTEGVVTLDGPSGHAVIAVGADGENLIVVFPGANRAVPLGRVEVALAEARPGDTFVTQNETNGQIEAAALARSRGLRVAYAAAPFDGGGCARHAALRGRAGSQ
jgi:hypothetical protein